MSYVVWIDHEEALTLPLESDQAHALRVPARTSALDPPGDDQRTRQLFDQTARSLASARRILMTGPGLAKHLFVNHVAEHHPKIFRKVAGCIDAVRPTQPELRAMGERFFRGLGKP